tara:strand:+ start:283 stop:1239 length:957 start_codon:yes stop_codon:yes gene_type:complete
MAINVSALNDFNNELAGKIVLDTVYKGNTTEYVSVQEGIKFQEPLNLISVDPYFQGGDSVSTASGSADFTQRNITVTKRTAYDSWNLQLLTEKYLGISALPEGSYEDTISLLNDMTGELVAKSQQMNDDFLWNAISGSTDGSSNSNVVAQADGFKHLISGSTAGIVVATGTGAAPITGSTAYAQLTSILSDVDVNVLDAGDLTFFCGTSVFQRIISGLTTQNLFHFDPTTVERRGGFYEVPLPGYPNVKIVGVYGLRGSERVICGPSSDMYVGTDLVSDTTNFQLWYDINADALKYRLRNKLGVQVGHPEYFVSNDQA